MATRHVVFLCGLLLSATTFLCLGLASTFGTTTASPATHPNKFLSLFQVMDATHLAQLHVAWRWQVDVVAPKIVHHSVPVHALRVEGRVVEEANRS